MAIYLENRSPWEQLGKLAGLWGANRIQQLQDINNAKDYAKQMYGGYDDQQKGTGLLSQLIDGNKTQVGNGLFAQNGLEAATPHYQINMNSQPDNFIQRTQNTLEASAPHYQIDMQQGQQQTRPSAPDRSQIKQSLRNKAGAAYVSFIKSGYGQQEAARMVKEMLENDTAEEYGKQLRDYQDSVLEPARQDILNQLVYTTDIDGNAAVSGYDPRKLKAMAPRIAAYNYRAQQLGLPQIDMNTLNSINSLDKPNISYKTMPNGQLVGINGDTGAVQNIGNYAAPQDPKRFYMNTGGGLFDTRSGQIVPGTAREVQGPGTSGYNSRIVAEISNNHMNWLKLHQYDPKFTEGGRVIQESDSPYYPALMQALGGRPAGGNGGEETPNDVTGGGNSSQDPIDRRIDELRAAGWSPEQIVDGLKKTGNEAYISHVW